MKIVGILTLAAFICGSVVLSSISYAQGWNNILSSGFKTEPWTDCASTVPCQYVGPKEWAPAESDFIQNTLVKFKLGGLSHILNTIHRLGFTSFKRTQKWYSLDLSNNLAFGQVKSNDYTYAITLNEADTQIILMDVFFNDRSADPITNVSLQEITLLHEIAHAYDYKNRFSDSAEFQKLAGFSPGFKVPSDQVSKANKEFFRLRDLNEFDKANQFSRQFGMKHGVPRIYSMGNPHEAFADLVAYIYFDENAPQYLDARLIQYIDENVLKRARAF